ncbi:MAG: fibronectin type III domain-containing protein, partial [Bdellovibrionales bacterium]|nr:fibronectin type III domain-containing protein [Bdellovibrionales bacterium]
MDALLEENPDLELKEDPNTGDLLPVYIDPPLEGDSTSVPGAPQPVVAAPSSSTGAVQPLISGIPDADTFFLHSRPNAQGKLYLNFVGGQFNDPSYWGVNNATVPAFTLDANSSFSSAELAFIKTVWLGVSEAFAIFNIDVTTEPIGNLNLERRAQIIISMYTVPGYLGFGGACALGSYALPQPQNLAGAKTCFAFLSVYNGSTPDTAGVIKTVSHEFGHSLGLNHWVVNDPQTGEITSAYYNGHGNNEDGSGYVPIMGAGAQAVHHWCKGDYPSGLRLNPNLPIQNDIAVITSSAGAVSDEAPDKITISNPTLMGSSSGGLFTVAYNALINHSNDIDVYLIPVSSNGSINLTIAPPPIKPHLDFRVRILKKDGTPVFKADPPGIGPITLSLSNLSSGNYYLEITPMGFMNPFNSAGYVRYGSIGSYRITGSYSQGSTSSGNDSTSPSSVSVTSPSSGSSVSGVVQLMAGATDNIGVQRVEFYDGTTLIDYAVEPPYLVLWRTNLLPNGSHLLKARAYDAFGNFSDSPSSNIIVNNPIDTVPPALSFFNLSQGQTIPKGNINVILNDSDNVFVNSVSCVNQQNVPIGSVVRFEKMNPPARILWNTSSLSGSQTITCTAQDTTGNQTSKSVTVNISGNSSDTSGPQISITSPANNASLTQQFPITISASASDPSGVTQVDFYYRWFGRSYYIGSDSTAPFSVPWNNSIARNGPYQLFANAFDGAFNTASSSQISVSLSIPDILPPSVPTPVSATSITNNSIQISWPPSTDDLGVLIYHVRINSSTTNLDALFNNYLATGLLPNTAYSFRVRACDPSGNCSAFS